MPNHGPDLDLGVGVYAQSKRDRQAVAAAAGR